MSVIAFRIVFTLGVKILWFGPQVSVCVIKWRENEEEKTFVQSISKINFACLLLKLLIYLLIYYNPKACC